MKALEEKIRREGVVLTEDILKVGSFLNQQVDAAFMLEIGQEIARLFKEDKVDKVLTLESSGIIMSVPAAASLGVPLLIAKKSPASTQTGKTYSSKVTSFTHGNTYFATVGAEYLKAGERVLIVDDFLARGAALVGLCDIVKQAGAVAVGAAIVIEKQYQGGGDKLRAEGLRIESLAKIAKMSPEAGITFAD